MKTQTKITIGTLCDQSNIPGKLIRAVVRQFGGWESFTKCAPDVTRHGIDGCFHGFIYNADMEAFAKQNRQEIQSMASRQASEFGTGVFEMIRGFGCFRYLTIKPTDEEIGSALYTGKNIEDGANILNALAWYAGEEVCRAYCDLSGENDWK